MTTPTATRYNLLKHLRVLFKSLNCLGLTGISFHQTDKKFWRPSFKHKATTCVYKFIQYFSGFLVLTHLADHIFTYTATTASETLRSIDAQEEILGYITDHIHTTSAFIHACNYFHMHDSLLILFNEALRIHKKLKTWTGPNLFFGSKIVTVLIVKSVILVMTMKYVVVIWLMMVITTFVNIDFLFFRVVSIVMSCTYIYVQVTLLCFYLKMNEHLRNYDVQMERRELVKCVRDFISVSRRIHAFQHRISSFSTCVFISAYIGLFHDIEFLYLTLKDIFYAKYFTDKFNETWFQLDFHYFPACFLYIFDVFIFGLLSDMLEGENDKFQNIVMKLSEDTPSLDRDVEVMVLRDKIRGLGFQVFGQMKINQQFSFDFTINMVLVFVIVFLQFFAAEQIYTKNFKFLTNTRMYVNHL